MVFSKYIVIILSLIASGVWISVFQTPNSALQIIACDVGQGDSILIQHKNDQILIDGGPSKDVLDCLGRHMPYWDHEIELIILTHPEKDHYGGLIEVLKTYQAQTFLTNDLSNLKFSSEGVSVLRKSIGGSSARVIHPTTGTKMRLGLIYLDIVHPTEGFRDVNTNNYSIVTLLTYNDFKAIFTGDIENKVSDTIADNWEMGTVDYIKIPHHGSKNGISESLLQATMPKTAVISVGEKNSYGHPHKEVLDIINLYSGEILRTDKQGDVVVEVDL